jgi:hypothetical protein
MSAPLSENIMQAHGQRARPDSFRSDNKKEEDVMIAESVLRPIRRTAGFLTVFACVAANAQPPTPSIAPTQGLGFAMVGIAPGQSARINALNQLPSPAAPGPAACRIALQFYDAEGQLVKEYVAVLAVGKSAAVDLNRDDLPGGDRLSLRGVLVFGYSGGANPPLQLLQQMATCDIVPSLEIYDNDTQKTSIVVTDAKPLPGPSMPVP